MSLPRSARFAEHQLERNVRKAAKMLVKMHSEEVVSCLNLHRPRCFKLTNSNLRLVWLLIIWQLDIAEALLLGLDC